MTTPERREGSTLFSVKADRNRFPAELWERFKRTAEERGKRWIDALREAVEQWIARKEKP
jgi:hypothetical protein